MRLDISTAGLMVAGVSVVSSGLQQVFVRTMQQRHKLSPHELLSNTAPAQAWTLLAVGPIIDKVVSADWVFAYDFTSGARCPCVFMCIQPASSVAPAPPAPEAAAPGRACGAAGRAGGGAACRGGRLGVTALSGGWCLR
jgi:hypothetical protein